MTREFDSPAKVVISFNGNQIISILVIDKQGNQMTVTNGNDLLKLPDITTVLSSNA